MGTNNPGSYEYIDLATRIFRILGQPAKLYILARIANGDKTIDFRSECGNIHESQVYHWTSEMRDAGLIEKVGRVQQVTENGHKILDMFLRFENELKEENYIGSLPQRGKFTQRNSQTKTLEDYGIKPRDLVDELKRYRMRKR